MEAKTCKQCGQLKPHEQFRQYYGGRKGRYTICLQCEKINSRLKYLEKKSNLTEAEQTEVNKIRELYDVQRAAGLQPPRQGGGRTEPITDSLDDMIEMYRSRTDAVQLPENTSAPAELIDWLSAPLTEEPDYYLDEIYEQLRSKYRPVHRIDTATMLPIYDETHAEILERILERFNEYEDNYYNED